GSEAVPVEQVDRGFDEALAPLLRARRQAEQFGDRLRAVFRHSRVVARSVARPAAATEGCGRRWRADRKGRRRASFSGMTTTLARQRASLRVLRRLARVVDRGEGCTASVLRLLQDRST